MCHQKVVQNTNKSNDTRYCAQYYMKSCQESASPFLIALHHQVFFEILLKTWYPKLSFFWFFNLHISPHTYYIQLTISKIEVQKGFKVEVVVCLR